VSPNQATDILNAALSKYQGAVHGLNTLDSQWQHEIQADDL